MVLKSNNDSVPILYSLHNCPYTIRARLALFKAQQRVLTRSIKLDNKPLEMLEASPKGSVPVFVISYPNLKVWLNGYTQSSQFSKVMKSYDLWLEERRDEYFRS
ncbi:hypothetical protein HB761_19460 [Vibrio campbellii]|uniref:GST N-terminal domain-containing protein n=1 Tax=Vibrio campbellii TaxID=680 RepID=A0AAE9SP31_9VIBR|nr:glutathione S-transferase N-terminal domain-containing protein [Vibrio campbellii]UTZ28852.1 hypothetical protein HB761_19460 [Vibrio campbellii]